jgi:superfamily I DNA/RNA helicase
VVAVLAAAGLQVAPLSDDGSAPARVSVVPAGLAKGLEFDHVVVVEPAAIVAAEPRGLHRLYVVLTRAVSSLVVLHSEQLPPQLGGTPGGERP